jgi:hypothetical protein
MARKSDQFYEGVKAALASFDDPDAGGLIAPYPTGSQEWWDWTEGANRADELLGLEEGEAGDLTAEQMAEISDEMPGDEDEAETV